MDRGRIRDLTKIKMDEVSPDNQGEIITPDILDELIESSLRNLILITPPHLLETKNFYQESSVDDNIHDNGDNTGYIILPDDFLRFISFKLDTWSKPVKEVISENSQKYARQKNTYTRGGIDKPICAVLYKPGTGKILEYYSTINNDHTVDHAYYVPVYSDEKDGDGELLYTYGVDDFQDDLIEPLTWLIARNAFDVFERHDMAEICKQKVQDFFDANRL